MFNILLLFTMTQIKTALWKLSKLKSFANLERQRFEFWVPKIVKISIFEFSEKLKFLLWLEIDLQNPFLKGLF